MDKVSKLYNHLAPEERLPLIVNAVARGDQTERERLIGSAPRQAIIQADYHNLAIALERLALGFVAEQLRLLVHCVEGLGAVILEGQIPDYVKYAAFEFTATFDSWKQFCIDCGIEPNAALDNQPGFSLIQNREERLRLIAFSFDEASEYLRESHPEMAPPLTVLQMAEGIREALNQHSSA